MSKEAIARIRSAEQQAADIRAKAAADAQRLREENGKACAEAHEERIKQTSADLRSRLADMQAKAEDFVRQSREEAKTEVQALEAAAGEHMKEAVKVIVWEMFDSCQ